MTNLRTKTFIFPDDVPRALARGVIKKKTPTPDQVSKRLDFIKKCLDHGVCPGLKGKPHNEKDRFSYECVPLPQDLKGHGEDLAQAVKHCFALLKKRHYRLARNTLEDIECLVEDIAQKADPDRCRGKAFYPKGRGPSLLGKAIDAALIKLGLTASARKVLDFINKDSDGPIEFIDSDNSIEWLDRSGERTTPWKRFNSFVSERRKKFKNSR